MPLYEYVCGACEHEWSDLVAASAPPPACPACGAARAEKRFSVFATSGAHELGGGGGGGHGCGPGSCSCGRYD